MHHPRHACFTLKLLDPSKDEGLVGILIANSQLSELKEHEAQMFHPLEKKKKFNLSECGYVFCEV